jgi:hypothetical protein
VKVVDFDDFLWVKWIVSDYKLVDFDDFLWVNYLGVGGNQSGWVKNTRGVGEIRMGVGEILILWG